MSWGKPGQRSRCDSAELEPCWVSLAGICHWNGSYGLAVWHRDKRPFWHGKGMRAEATDRSSGDCYALQGSDQETAQF